MSAPTPQDVARSAARRFCGWHVTPVLEEDVQTLDGPGSRLLVLPTLRLGELTAVVEDGVALNVATDLHVSVRGLVRKRSGASWSKHYGSIVVTMKHGFDDALDFDAVVASYAERTAGDKPTTVGPFKWDSAAMADGSAFSVTERALLEQYRLEPAP